MHVGDTIFIFCLALIIFGPKKLPEIGRQIGKLMVEFRRASNEFKMQIEDELRASEEAERQKEITAAAASVTSPTPEVAALSAPAETHGTEASIPVIAPPVTGLPVNHTFASDLSPEPVGATNDQTLIADESEAYSEPAGEFNPGLNTASNGVIAEVAETVSVAPEAMDFHPGETPASDSEKAQAPAHHG